MHIRETVETIVTKTIIEIDGPVEAVHQVRVPVANFAAGMEEVLQQNDYKGGWRTEDSPNNTLAFFRDKLTEEFTELQVELKALSNTECQWTLTGGIGECPSCAVMRERIRHEAIDVANIAMMIADNFGGGVQ